MIKCPTKYHENIDIDIVCLNQFCKGMRFQCFDCFKSDNSHSGHTQEVYKWKDAKEKLHEYQNKLQIFSLEYEKQMFQVQLQLYQLMESIKQKSTITLEKLLKLNAQQQNERFTWMTTFENSQIKYLEDFKNESNKLIDFVNQLKKELTLDDYDKKLVEEMNLLDIYISQQLSFQGIQLYDKEQEKAKEYFKKSLEFNPLNKCAISEIGNILMEKQEWKDALIYFQRAEQLDGRDLKIKFNKVKCLKELNQFQDAIDTLKQSLNVKQNDLESLREISDLLFKQNYYDQAIEYLNQILKIIPQDAFALYLKGTVLYKKQFFEEAVEYFELFLRIDPRNFDVLFMQSVSLFEILQLEDSTESNELKELTQQSNLDKLYLQSCELFFHGQYDQSMKQCEKIISINSNYLEANHLKDILQQ